MCFFTARREGLLVVQALRSRARSPQWCFKATVEVVDSKEGSVVSILVTVLNCPLLSDLPGSRDVGASFAAALARAVCKPQNDTSRCPPEQ